MQSKAGIGVIGIGAMGMGVAVALLRAGFAVHVRDIRAQAEHDARAAGAIVCASPAELARECATVITLVVDAGQTDEVLFGESGAVDTLAPGAVVLMCSTIAPSHAQSTARRLAERGIAMLDAPVSGGPAKAHAGEMSMMIAGDAAAFAGWIFADRMPRVLANDYAPRAAVNILTKDLSILLDAAQEAGFPAPIAAAAHQVYLQTVALGLGGEDDAALVKAYAALTGIALPGKNP